MRSGTLELLANYHEHHPPRARQDTHVVRPRYTERCNITKWKKKTRYTTLQHQKIGERYVRKKRYLLMFLSQKAAEGLER